MLAIPKPVGICAICKQAVWPEDKHERVNKKAYHSECLKKTTW